MSPEYRKELEQLKKGYSKLPWYKRFWFSLWSFRLSNALAQIDPQNTTDEQVRTLIELSNQTWFFKSIFGLLERFKQQIERFKQQSLYPHLYTNPFNELPAGLKTKIAESLSSRELANLAYTSNSNNQFFKPLLSVRKFLQHVVHGKESLTYVMLNEDFELLVTKGRVTDYSGRTFFNISAFQYALWALDKHSWTMMLDCLSQNQQGEEVDVKSIRAKLLAQYLEVEQKGVTYELEGKIIPAEKHYDFAIIKALQEQCDLYDKFSNSLFNWAVIRGHWRTQVGGAQRKVPIHVVYEYCDNTPFSPIPDFQKPPAPTQGYSFLTNEIVVRSKSPEKEKWFSGSSHKLGVDFAIWKGGWKGALGITGTMRPNFWRASIDLAAMQKLCEVRTNEFKALKQQLLKAPEAQSSVSHGL